MPVLQDLPLPLLALVCLGSTVGLGVGGVLVVRRKRWFITERDIGTAAALHALIGVLYAVALGLLVVRVEEAFDSVQSVTDAEAIATGDLYRTLGGLADPARSTLRRDLRQYLTLVVDKEWPAIERGDESDTTWRAIDNISRTIVAYIPVGAKEALIYPQLLTNMQSLLDARRQRIFRGTNGIENMTWLVIVLGAIVTIGGACFFSMEHKLVHLVLIGCASAMLGMMIFLVVAMDRPLRGGFSVDPSAFTRQQANFDRLGREEAPSP
jgi:hypothetical protein